MGRAGVKEEREYKYLLEKYKNFALLSV